MPVTMKDEREDAREAWQRGSLYRSELNEIYRYFMPFRQSTAERANDGGGQSEAANRTNHLFDSTGVSAAFNFAGMMSQDWMPPFQDFFKIEAGPLVPADQRDELNKKLAALTEVCHGVLPRSRVTAHEMFLDLFAGTGAMLHTKGDARMPVRGQTVPVNELAFEEGPHGDVESTWWNRNYKGKHIERMWPDGKISDTLAKKIKESRNSDIRITQSTRFDAGADRFVLRVYAEGDDEDAIIHSEEYRTNPWQVVRFFKVPGEAYGRGLAHIGLPGAKTVNKVRELAVRAAAFAVMGLWMRRNDGVFNPDTSVFSPLAMWTVASTGGPLGATIQRLPVPQDFDVSSFIMKDERDLLNKALMNDELPELQDSVRSPTEIAARLRKVAKNKGGAGARISIELVTALAQRTVDILETLRLIDTSLSIDMLLTKTTVTAPAAAAQRADRVQWAIDWMQMMLGLMGPQALLVGAKVEELLPEIGRWMGVDDRFIRSKGEQKEFKELLRAITADQAKQMAQAEAKQATPPQQAYVNGGAF